MTEEIPTVGPWARDKLDRLQKYLSAYTRIMAKQPWAQGYVYVDAFAGPGRARVRPIRSDDPTYDIFESGEDLRKDEEARQVLDGSPRMALQIEHPFTHYVFLERDPERAEILKRIQHEYKDRRNIVVGSGDCNNYLNDKLINNPQINWKKWRGVVFLDPFGMQVPWVTIAGLAKTRAIEVFLNFPVGMSIQRLLRRDGKFTDKQLRKLNDYFGDPGWFEIVYTKSIGLFGASQSKAGDAEQRLVKWYRERLGNAFGYVSDAYLIKNSHGGHLYFLIFAGPNQAGAKIANDILRSGARI